MTQQTITVHQDIQAERRAAAEAFRSRQAAQGTLVVHLLSSPGAGKTALLEATARQLGHGHALAVLVGDIATDRDAQRLAPWAPAVQITTGGACHLELPLVEKALERLDRPGLEFLFVEDVGNLVCPASHDLGEHLRVLLLSTTEGDDKPGKYPKAFRTSQALVLSKIDLLPYVPFSVDAAIADARRIQPQLTVFPVCALDGRGVDAWCQYLMAQRERLLYLRPVTSDKGAAS
jgi:hydrogenase nickel incorporation protein HypB